MPPGKRRGNLLVVIALLSSCAPSVKDPMQLPVLEREMTRGGEVSIQVRCPETAGHEGEMLVIIPPPMRSLAAESLRVDITPFKDGFTTGEYVTVSPVSRGAQILHSKSLSMRSADHRMSPLRGLRFAETALQAEGRDVWKVEGLEPGVNYYVRLAALVEKKGWAPAAIVRVQGPICPTDEVEPRRP